MCELACSCSNCPGAHLRGLGVGACVGKGVGSGVGSGVGRRVSAIGFGTDVAEAATELEPWLEVSDIAVGACVLALAPALPLFVCKAAI